MTHGEKVAVLARNHGLYRITGLLECFVTTQHQLTPIANYIFLHEKFLECYDNVGIRISSVKWLLLFHFLRGGRSTYEFR